MGGTGCSFDKTFFLHSQRRYSELSKIPTYLPRRWAVCVCLWAMALGGVCTLCLCARPRVHGTERPSLPRTWSCAVVVAGSRPFWRASWHRVGASRLVWSNSSQCKGRSSPCRSAFPYWGITPPDLLGGFTGHVEADREPGSWCLLLIQAAARALGSLRVVPVQGPAMGLSLAGPTGVGLGLRALRCFGQVWTWSLTRLLSRAVPSSTGCSTGAPGMLVWTPTPPLSGRRTPREGPLHVYGCVLLLARSGWAASRAWFGAPHLPCGRSPFSLFLLGPLQGGVALFLFVSSLHSFFFPLSPARCVFWPLVSSARDLLSLPPPNPPLVSCSSVPRVGLFFGFVFSLSLVYCPCFLRPPPFKLLFFCFAPSCFFRQLFVAF